MLKDNLEYFIRFASRRNSFGEPVTLVGATKTQSAETVNEAIKLGLKDVGENRAQEFRDKFPELLPVNYHFFGRLQPNKLKYIVGKACLIHSVDSLELAEAISNFSLKLGVKSNVLLEVNLGEAQKGGIPLDKLPDVVEKIVKLPYLAVKGLMTVLPKGADDDRLYALCTSLRRSYDELKRVYDGFSVLSMGMTADYKIAVGCGSNMIRIGTGIFGERNYNAEEK